MLHRGLSNYGKEQHTKHVTGILQGDIMNRKLYFLLLILTTMISQRAFALDLPYLNETIHMAVDTENTLPAIRFLSPSTDKNLAILGKVFFGFPLRTDMAQLDNGRYLYFKGKASELWYYPYSGAVEWKKQRDYKKISFDISNDSLLRLSNTAFQIISILRGGHLFPGEEVSFVRYEKKVTSTGTFSANESEPVESIGAVQLKYQQRVFGVPIDGGSYALVTFCGDEEVCGIEILMREIESVTDISYISSNEILTNLDVHSQDLKSKFFINAIDMSKNAVIVYPGYSKSSRQMGAVPALLIPVCIANEDDKESTCERSDALRSYLVGNPDDFEQTERAVPIFHVSPNGAVPLMAPEHCTRANSDAECAP